MQYLTLGSPCLFEREGLTTLLAAYSQVLVPDVLGRGGSASIHFTLDSPGNSVPGLLVESGQAVQDRSSVGKGIQLSRIYCVHRTNEYCAEKQVPSRMFDVDAHRSNGSNV